MTEPWLEPGRDQAIRVQNKSWLVSQHWLLTSSHGDKAEWSWTKHSKWDKPPDELIGTHLDACAQILQKQNWSTLSDWPANDSSDNKKTKKKQKKTHTQCPLWGSHTAPSLCSGSVKLQRRSEQILTCDTDFTAASVIPH